MIQSILVCLILVRWVKIFVALCYLGSPTDLNTCAIYKNNGNSPRTTYVLQQKKGYPEAINCFRV